MIFVDSIVKRFRAAVDAKGGLRSTKSSLSGPATAALNLLRITNCELRISKISGGCQVSELKSPSPGAFIQNDCLLPANTKKRSVAIKSVWLSPENNL